MIDAYVWTTPNGFKALIALEELGLPYRAHWVDISKGEQLEPAYLAINPNHKIPAIVDHDGPGGTPVTVFESGAVLTYLAEKTGRFLAKDGADRYAQLAWVFFNIGNTGPMLGQLGFFAKFAPEKIPLAIDRYTKEAERLFGVLDRQLAQAPYLAGAAYSIADMINVTWPRGARDFLGLDLSAYPNLTRWIAEIEARPAVARALAMKPDAKPA
ncbi:MAG: glutathione S-transferase N-terminal domain-containing protein [Myxococcales bacterium]|nr:glutathione S-transferase N-terminal domain-containing protein [Myxococcales bacterium]